MKKRSGHKASGKRAPSRPVPLSRPASVVYRRAAEIVFKKQGLALNPSCWAVDDAASAIYGMRYPAPERVAYRDFMLNGISDVSLLFPKPHFSSEYCVAAGEVRILALLLMSEIAKDDEAARRTGKRD